MWSVVVALAALCFATPGAARDTLQSITCLTPAQMDRLMTPPVSVSSARKLANFFGICLSDGQNHVRWLTVAASQGDLEAAHELANILPYMPHAQGDLVQKGEAAHWSRVARGARPRR
jgi:hypothetical protein